MLHAAASTIAGCAEEIEWKNDCSKTVWAKQGVSCYYCTLTHCTRSDRRLRLNHVEWKEGRGGENAIIAAAWKCLAQACAFTHLLSRQQIHSADGDELGDVCTATILPDLMTVKRCDATGGGFPVCRWSLMNMSSGCAPSPPRCYELPHTTRDCCCCCCCLHHGMQMTCVRLP